ncbi:ubiquitin fusion degradation protein 1 [Cryptococcus bacillisporus CA1873]|uniref:Ubiquitin fusion degradation protein 1 n=1 Tax=Cryptococcus bacillisporus CA1873 TaxID=1296111 RepID=A0ABR5B7V0_CRYGA|nr:ubiquitin fusion degradation protein 1 [Cryptococcus bacillisporus CA1873]|eukprot:KIR59464.1 ubiquitin fusion degradation protein 1 [Cryptococcus gattii CA1873]
MNHGYDSEDEFDSYAAPPPLPGGPASILSHLMGGGFGGFHSAPPPSAYDDYFKAYSTAVMGGRERPEVMYGGKIIMPPSALARLSALDIPSPWTFQLRNPRSPTQHTTHAGVLEFIAEEGIVHLPAWMMTRLNLEEGDPVRLTGAKLPKGKMVKIQAQSTDFLQVSDPKSVLESALRFYSTLSPNDIIEITYNSLTFEFLIMSVVPEGPGISVIDTDLEVDFATPKGYVEPPRPEPKPIPTMADKLNIDLSSNEPTGSGAASVSGGSRPGTSMGTQTPVESFTGVGQSLSGKKVKGKGLAKKIEEVDPSSKINRADGPRIINTSSLSSANTQVPSALILPEGKFFFGFKYIPYNPSKAPKPSLADQQKVELQPFGGEGNTLKNGKRVGGGEGKGKGKEKVAEEEKEDPWAKLGSGNTLKRTTATAASSSSNPVPASAPQKEFETRKATEQEIIDATMLDEDDFMFEDGEDDEDDVIEIDSDYD